MADPFPSISSLVPHLREDDFDSWQSLFDRFHTGMLSKARRLLKSSELQMTIDPDDLIQETFKKAWLGFGSFRGENTAQLAKWLLTILKNTFLNHCRSKPSFDQRASNLPDWEILCDPGETPAETLDSLEQEARLHACIAELSPDDQQLLSLKNFEGLTYREIADQLESTASTVCGMHSRAMHRLSKLIRSESYCLVIRKKLEPPASEEKPE